MTLLPAHGVVQAHTVIRRERTLPRPGEVLKRPGQSVGALDVVARARVPPDHHIIDIGRELSVSVEHVDRYMLKRPGDTVEEDEPIAARRAIFGLRRIMVHSPVEGEVVESGGGVMILEGAPDIIEVKASLTGVVTDIKPPWGVVVETEGAQVQLAWGHGQMAYSELKMIVPDEEGGLDARVLDDMEHRGTIVVAAAPLTEDFLRAASRARVEGVIGASMDAGLVSLVEELELTAGLSAGFGQLPMSQEIYELLRASSGRQITFDPGSAERWRISRPEIIISLPGDTVRPDIREPGEPLEVGDRVRILRGPRQGAIGSVRAVPDHPRRLPSGLWLEGAEVVLKDGQVTFVPFANLEHLG